jgi:hypothetical protein
MAMSKIMARRAAAGWLCLLIAAVAGAQRAAAQAPVPAELQMYVGVKTIADLSREELLGTYSELNKNLTFAQDESQLPEILQKVGENVRAFFQYFPNTASVEDVRQDVLRPDGRVVDRARGKYNYLMLVGTGHGIGLEEFRSDPRGNEAGLRGPARGFMLTSRCMWHLVHFHPVNLSGSRFRYLGMSTSPPAHVIAFAQKPEDAKEAAQIGVWDPDMAGRKLLMLIQGIVWVDPGNFQVLRMRTDLLAPRYDIGLSKDTTEIDFTEIQFPGVTQSFWLPREVVVTTVFRNHSFINRHRYSDYRLFTVESRDKINPPIPP